MHAVDRNFEFTPANDCAGHENGADRAAPPIRAIVVEDQVLIALSLIADLTALGCFVVARAASGERAIAEARVSSPDIVFMDVDLAGAMDGIEAARRILETEDTCIVFVTAYAEGALRTRMTALKPLAILGKPYDHRDLADLVARIPRSAAGLHESAAGR